MYRFLLFCGALLLSVACVQAQVTTSRPTEGLHEASPRWFVIENATVHVTGGKTLADASVVVHGEKIVAVGSTVTFPEGAERIDGTGRHIYPGFIDAYVPLSAEDATPPATEYWNAQVKSHVDMAQSAAVKGVSAADYRKAGITAGLLAPNNGIIQGRSAVFLMSDASAAESLVRDNVAMHVQLTTRFRFGGGGSGGPTSPMGAYALARQAMYDAQWYRDAWQVAKTNSTVPRPEANVSLEALQPVLTGDVPIMVNASNEIFALRANRFAREFGLRLILMGSGNEYRRLQEVVALQTPLIVPLDFPEAPSLKTAQEVLDVSLESLMHWDHAPENPARLIAAGAQVAFTSDGIEKKADFLKQLRTAVKRGVPGDDAINALTLVPAKMLGVEKQLGSIAPGKLASLVVTDGPLFDDKSKIVETWVAGVRDNYAPRPQSVDGLWEATFADNQQTFYLSLSTEPKLSGKWSTEKPEASKTDASEAKPKDAAEEAGSESESESEVDSDEEAGQPDAKSSDDDAAKKTTADLKELSLVGALLSGQVDAAPLDASGTAIFSLQLDQPESGSGNLLLPDGSQRVFLVTRVGDVPKAESKGPSKGRRRSTTDEEANTDTDAEKGSEKSQSETDHADTNAKSTTDTAKVAASFPVNYPFGDFGHVELPQQAGSCLFTNVTIWTCGPAGIIENGSLLISRGRIEKIFGAGDELPSADLVVDGQGMHLTPGLIDCHSHMATDSGVNEVGQAITAEVRIGDFIDCDDITIYRQLAGGLTTSNILHGSANPIGGQNQVIKLRWGVNDADMKFAEAPQGIKFALGENVKQSNRRESSSRYPQTRMGVEQIMHDTFRAAQEYAAAHQKWKTNREGLPPRVDLELEAIAEILNGTRWIHCHSYRQDEILALIRVLDHYGITIGSFQHILEGYKVADAIARHGGTASAFSDWWAYKFEVFDAIPYAGAIMHDAGIVVSFNSDDGELARHMNHEAAKAVRYGGVPEQEALKFVTLNPAKQLRIDEYVGSIEVGKHADLALWSGHPLALTSRCEQTWIDGRKYFDRAEAAERATEQATQKAALIQKALQTGGGNGSSGRGRFDDSLLWPRYDEYCHGHDHDHDHEHEQALEEMESEHFHHASESDRD